MRCAAIASRRRPMVRRWSGNPNSAWPDLGSRHEVTGRRSVPSTDAGGAGVRPSRDRASRDHIAGVERSHSGRREIIGGCGIVVRTRQRWWLPEASSARWSAPRARHTGRPPGFYRRLQSIAPVFRKLGMTSNYVVELEVAGRRSGIPIEPSRPGRSPRRSLSRPLPGSPTGAQRPVGCRARATASRPGDGAARLVELPVDQRAEPSAPMSAVSRGRASHGPNREARHSLRDRARFLDRADRRHRRQLSGLPRRAGRAPDSSAGPDPRRRGTPVAHPRASPTDRAMLAMGWARSRKQIEVLLVLDAAEGLDRARLTALLDERVRAVPPLRRRPHAGGSGCGGPDLDRRSGVRHPAACPGSTCPRGH